MATHGLVLYEKLEPLMPSEVGVDELLKAIPLSRVQPGRLLVCATNFIDNIDPAVIRPG